MIIVIDYKYFFKLSEARSEMIDPINLKTPNHKVNPYKEGKESQNSGRQKGGDQPKKTKKNQP